MNFAMVSTHYSKMCRRISATYAMSVAGAVLAISAVVAFLGHVDGAPPPPAAMKAVVPITWTYTDHINTTQTIFLVDSLVEALLVQQEQALAQDAAAFGGLALPQGVLIVVKGSPIDQDLFGASGAAVAAGTNIQVTERPFRLAGTAAQP